MSVITMSEGGEVISGGDTRRITPDDHVRIGSAAATQYQYDGIGNEGREENRVVRKVRKRSSGGGSRGRKRWEKC